MSVYESIEAGTPYRSELYGGVSPRAIRELRQWFADDERVIRVTYRVNSHIETRSFTPYERDAVFTRMDRVQVPTADATSKADPSLTVPDVHAWWGVVAAIDEVTQTFVAELHPERLAGTDEGPPDHNVRFSAEFLLTHVPSGDRDRLVVGSTFLWRSELDELTGRSSSWIEVPEPDFASEQELAAEEERAAEWLRRHGFDETP